MSAGSPTGAPHIGPYGDGSSGFDLALSVTVPRSMVEEVGAVLMDVFGPFEESVGPGASGAPEAGSDPDTISLLFYPRAAAAASLSAGRGGGSQDSQGASGKGSSFPSAADVLALLPPVLRDSGAIGVDSLRVARDWVDGWKEHFHPIMVGRVCIRPPWEAPMEPSTEQPGGGEDEFVDVVINPGLGFGTGLHATTRGTLELLQEELGSVVSRDAHRGALLDAGTGSGVLAIAAAKLGWEPIVAFDNDPAALASASENVAVNSVAQVVEVREAEVDHVPIEWARDATVLANLTLEPVLALLGRLASADPMGRPHRLVVSGILAGAQEQELLRTALMTGFDAGRRVYEAEWVSLELLPADSPTVEAYSVDAIHAADRRQDHPGVRDAATTEGS